MKPTQSQSKFQHVVTVDKLMVKYTWKDQKTQSSQQSTEGKAQRQKLTLSDF